MNKIQKPKFIYGNNKEELRLKKEKEAFEKKEKEKSESLPSFNTIINFQDSNDYSSKELEIINIFRDLYDNTIYMYKIKNMNKKEFKIYISEIEAIANKYKIPISINSFDIFDYLIQGFPLIAIISLMSMYFCIAFKIKEYENILIFNHTVSYFFTKFLFRNERTIFISREVAWKKELKELYNKK